jgi:PilZ domain
MQMLENQQQSPHELGGTDQDWPSEVRLIISALEAADHHDGDRRHEGRSGYRTRAALQLFSDPDGTEPWPIYTRDVSPRALGFLTQTRLPLGHGGVVEIPAPDGRILSIPCTLLRCRETANGWFEAAVHFNREQFVFSRESAVRE